jgi:hypothetical protein
MHSRTLIKIPLYQTFDIAYIHPLTSEISNFYKPEPDEGIAQKRLIGLDLDKEEGRDYNELKLINNSLKYCTKLIRDEIFYSLDILNKNLIESLKKIEFKESVTLSFEDSRRDHIVLALPLTGITTKINYPQEGYSLKSLLLDSKNGCNDSLKRQYISILEVLAKNDLKSDLAKLTLWYENSKLKPRTTTKILFGSGDLLTST